MECIVTYIEEINTNVVLVYRPESYTSSVFIEEMYRVLTTLPQHNTETSTIVLGDFNQDILKTNSPIKKFMEQQGFTQFVTCSTTDGNTLIDHVYLCGNLQLSVECVQTYYSYHNMLVLKIRL
jgi:endonuclease/exonuclease/phosphatase (EEP) superfamily protein YafD